MVKHSEKGANAQEVFAPVIIRYDGLDAEAHRIDLDDFGKSAQGMSKILATVGQFVVTQNYDSAKRKLDCKVTIEEPKANCFSIKAFIELIDASPLAYTVLSGIFLIVFQYVWSVVTGKKEEMERLHSALIASIEQLGRKDDVNRLMDTIDKMAVGLLPAAKDAVHPIGTTCEKISFGDGREYFTRLNNEDKEAINNAEVEITEERHYRVLISELDMRKFTCKVSLADEIKTRYNAKIADPEIEAANNKYALATAAKRFVTIRAKLKKFKGKIREFVISDVQYEPKGSDNEG